VSKEQVLAAFNKEVKKGEPQVGETVAERIKITAKEMIVNDRAGVVGALRYWIKLRDQNLTQIALSVIAEVKTSELKPDLEKLKADVDSRKALNPNFVYLIDFAMNAIGGSGDARIT
jgi:hypothetical protein